MNCCSSDIEICRDIHKQYGPNYFFATRFFPQDLREATWILYAFVRVADEIVDNPGHSNPDAIRQELEDWIALWKNAHKTEDSSEPVLRAMACLCKKYTIPYRYTEEFLAAMIQDIYKKRYKTYEELEQYTYGSAATVGLMMTHIIGYNNSQAFKYAKSLGYAMQMTNFLRDIKEDYTERDRIYMPLNELDQFNITEEDIASERMSDEFKAFMKFQLQRTEMLYTQADLGIPMLSWRGRFAVKLARNLYSAIDRKIEQQGYDVFSKRASTTLFEKMCIVLYSLLPSWRNVLSS